MPTKHTSPQAQSRSTILYPAEIINTKFNKQRRHLRSQLPTQDILNHVHTLNKEIDEDIKREQLNKWKQTLDTISFNANPSRLFKLIRCFNN